MFYVYNNPTSSLTQWNQGYWLSEPSMKAGDKVIFRNSSGLTCIMTAYREDGDVCVDVPNKLLTMDSPILVYIKGRYETRSNLPVKSLPKPDWYVLSDNTAEPSDAVDNVIELSDYMFDEDNEKTVNDAVVELAMSGGGVVSVDKGMDCLWADIIAKQPEYFILNLGLGANCRITINLISATKAYLSEAAFFSGTGVVSVMGMNMNVTCVLTAANDGQGVIISVLSEPVTFPGA